MRGDPLEPGVYSELVTHALSAILGDPDADPRALLTDLRNAEAPDRLSRHLAAVVSRLIKSLAEESRADDGADLVAELITLLDRLRPASGVLDDQVAGPPRVLDGIRFVRPDGTLAPLDLPLTPLLGHDRPDQRPRRAGDPARVDRRDSVGHQRGHLDGVRSVEWRSSALAGVAAPLRRGTSRPAAHDDVHEQHGGESPRRTGVGRCRGSGLVRHDDDPSPREGMALPSPPRGNDRVHRVVESDPQRPGHRARVERGAFRDAQSRRRLEDGRCLRVVLGGR